MSVPHFPECAGSPPTIGCPGCIWLATAKPTARRARRTAENNATLDAGHHPASLHPLADHGTCADCIACERLAFAGAPDRFRCALTWRTTRLSWPACIEAVARPAVAG